MGNWATVMVPAFFDETKELDAEVLKSIAQKAELDMVTLKNALIGRGIGFILKTPRIEKIDRIVSALSEVKIPCLPANSVDVNSEIKVVYVKSLFFTNDGLKINSFKGDSYIVKDKILLVSDVLSQSISSIKKAVLPASVVTLISKKNVFVIDFSKTRISTLSGEKGISQKANFVQVLEAVGKEFEIIIDSTYYFQSGFFLKDIVMLSMFLAYSYKYGLYGKALPDSILKKVEKRQKPIYDYKIIRPGIKAALYKYKTQMRGNILYPPLFWIGFIFVLMYLGLRFQVDLFLLVASVLGVVIFTFKLFRVWKIRHLIEDTPTSRLRSVAAGFVEVSGKITSNKPVISPISGSPCVFFRYFKERLVKSGRRYRWQLVEVGEGFADNCVLKDETGEIGINVKNASFYLTNKYTTNTDFFDMQYGGFADNKTRYKEEYILDNQMVYVLGTAKPVSKSISYGKFLSELKKDKEKMKKFDVDNNGVIDVEEWEEAQKLLKNEYLKYKQSKGQAIDLVIDFDRSNGVFIISNEEEGKIVKNLKLAQPLYFVGSLVFLVITLWLTVKIF